MARPKGQPKLGGRAKGTPNKATTDLRTFVQSMLDEEREDLKLQFSLLKGEKKIAAFDKLLSYVLPRQSATTAKVDVGALSDQDIERIIKDL